MVQVLRNITNKNSPGVLHAAVTALQNSCFHELTRQDLVFCGAVATLSDFTTEV